MQLRLHDEVLTACRNVGAFTDVEHVSKRAGFTTIDATTIPTNALEAAVPALEAFATKHRSHLALRSVQVLIAARHGGAQNQTIPAGKDAPGILRAYLLEAGPDHVLWREEHDHWLPFFVHDILLVTQFGGTTILQIQSRFWETGNLQNRTFQINASATTGRQPSQVLAAMGLFTTSADITAAYEQDLDAFKTLDQHIGLQVLGRGYGHVMNQWNKNRWRHYDIHCANRLERDGEPANLVVDIYSENEDADQDEPVVATTFWTDAGGSKRYPAPIHPRLHCFDLRRHQHVLVNAGDVEVYQYDQRGADHLILPETDRNLIDILMASGGEVYRDIVQGKGGGIIVLSTGPPGTGKTLTAEVQAERLERPLYVVQSSQLGIGPAELEDRLRTVLARAARWHALLLIDEADVYIHERGENLAQNAVVGVFLRLLEYYQGHLFMATNREVIIDDAIISRATAHLRYRQPDEAAREAIWATLAHTAGLNLADGLSATMAREWSWTSGRDIKNALKLASMTASGAITAHDLEAVQPYIPRTRRHPSPDDECPP